jgi:hypothetical protein
MDRPQSRLLSFAGLVGVVGALRVSVAVSTATAPALTDVDCAGGWVLSLPGQADACAHPDQPPPGVDVHEAVPLEQLRARPGAGAASYGAAQDLGGPGAYATTATSRAVTCEGDGVTGARVQAMYVVEAGRTNRYLDLVPSLQLWAAGTDDVVNRSAALTGGARSIRYVTDVSGSSCVARVLNVTVPAGAAATFSSLVSAVQALGYTSASRKYLMWTDATALCGVASMYPDENPAQDNRNNGSYAQYARVDSGCWGFGNGAEQHSVEAHELVHTLGGVQYQAPHSTRAGHCWDEADTMCYADGGSHAMVSVCPSAQEYLLDCGSDDYFSTYPSAGSYLAGAWNAASNRFLVGGGNGTSGGSLGSPTTLGGSLAVNNPAVPGLPTQASVTPELPAGRSLAGVAWRVGSTACAVVAQGDGTQAAVTCPAASTTPTTVTATLTDSTGATRSVTSPLTFQTTGARRAVSLALTVDGQSATAAVCTGVPAVGRVVAVDAATGVPVRGLTTVFSRRAATALTTTAAGTRVTDPDGAATTALATGVPVTYGGTTAAVGMFLAGTATPVAATPARCTAVLSGAAGDANPWYGGTVTVTGTLRRTVASASDTPVSGVAVQVTVKAPDVGTTVGRTTVLASAQTTTAGAFTASFRATTSGRLAVVLPPSTGLEGASSDLGDLAVRIPTTQLTATADRSDVGYGSTTVVRGALTKAAPGTLPVGSAAVRVFLTAPGAAPVQVGSGVTTASGGYAVAAALRTAGQLSVVYSGGPGLPGATADAGPVTVGSWVPTLTLTSGAGTVSAGSPVAFSGTASRTYDGVTEPARSLRVALVLTPRGGGTPVVLGYASVGSLGTFRAVTYPRGSGTVTAVVSGVTGYEPTTSAGVALTVA